MPGTKGAHHQHKTHNYVEILFWRSCWERMVIKLIVCTLCGRVRMQTQNGGVERVSGERQYI